MKKKEIITGLFVLMLLLSTVLPAAGIITNFRNNKADTYPIITSGGEWYLQWSKKYGDNLRSGGPRPIGDIDEDGINEVIVCGRNHSVPGICRILSYDEEQGTYIEEHSWNHNSTKLNIETNNSSFNCIYNFIIIVGFF